MASAMPGSASDSAVTIRLIRSGMAVTMEDAIRKTASVSAGRLFRTVSVTAPMRCKTASTTCGSAVMIALRTEVRMEEISFTKAGRLSTTSFRTAPSRLPMRDRSVGIYCSTVARMSGIRAATFSDITPISPFAPKMAFVNLPSRSTPSLPSFVKTGSRTVPRAFLAATHPTLRYWIWSSKAP